MNILPENNSEMHHYTSTLAKKSNDLMQEGYIEQFTFVEEGLHSATTNKTYHPEEVKIVKHYRFEGTSDPADMSILYAIETNDGLKGTVTDAFGTYSDFSLGEFMNQVEELENQNHPK
jgi:hypothetical protein